MKWGFSRFGHDKVAPKRADTSASAPLPRDMLARDIEKEDADVDLPTHGEVANRDERSIAQGDSGERVRSEEVAARRPYVVPAGYRITGAIFSPRSVEVRGECAGRLRTSGDVTIAAGARSSGGIQAKRIIVYGDVSDRLVALDRIDLQSGGRITAPVTSPTLSIAAGGILAADSVTVGHEPRAE